MLKASKNIDDLSRSLKSFNDPIKFKILHLIANEITNTKQIAQMVGVSPPTVSYHLNNFKNNHIITSSKAKDSNKYTINNASVVSLKDDSLDALEITGDSDETQ